MASIVYTLLVFALFSVALTAKVNFFGFPFAEESGDISLAANPNLRLDEYFNRNPFAQEIELPESTPFIFFQIPYRYIYVTGQGALFLSQSNKTYLTMDNFFFMSENVIAPLWKSNTVASRFGSCVDITGSGFLEDGKDYECEELDGVVYRELTTASHAKLLNEISQRAGDFLGLPFFMATWGLIVTWDQVENTGVFEIGTANTFQIVIATNGEQSVAIYNYAKVASFTGRGYHAIAGYNSLLNATQIIKSTVAGDDIGDLSREVGNTGNEGEWIFRIDKKVNVTFAECTGSGTISPSASNLYGGTPVVVTLESSCIMEDYDISCVFGRTEVSGKYISDKQAYCISPTMENTGRVSFAFKLNKGSREIFSTTISKGFIFKELYDTVEVDVFTKDDSLLISNMDTIDLLWPKELIPKVPPENYTVGINMIWFDLSAKSEPIKLHKLKEGLPNTGEARGFVMDIPAKSSPFPKSESAIMIIFEVSADVPGLGQVAKRTFVYFLRNIKSEKKVQKFDRSFREQCQKWAFSQDPNKINNVFNSLPPCPPTERQALLPNSQVRKSPVAQPHESSRVYFRQFWNFFSPNLTCYGPNVHSHCCYDYDGNLKVGPPGGGHMNLVQTLELEHLRGDFLPYVYCCKDSRFDNCDFYYENRPSDDGSRYMPPPPACVYGDPHLVTLDGYKYTFNGKGEYIIIETSDNSFTLQARMEEALAKDGSPAGATIFTAVVAKEKDSDAVQIQLWESRLVAVVDGEIYNFFEKESFKGVEVSRKGLTTISALFSSSSAYIEVSKNEDSNGHPFISTLIVSLPRSFKGKTRGLMGSFNDDQSDDLKPRHSDDPISLNSSMEIIHNDFGITWIIRNESESIFDYSIEEGTSWSTYFHPKFIPKFEIAFSTPDEKAMAEEVCKDDPFCLYDIAATSDVVVGMSTLNGSETLVEIMNASHPATCNPPCVHGACVLTDTCNCLEGYQGNLCDEFTDLKAKSIVEITRRYKVSGGYTIFWEMPSPDTKGFLITVFLINEEHGNYTMIKEITVGKKVRAFQVDNLKENFTYRFELRKLLEEKYGPPAVTQFF